MGRNWEPLNSEPLLRRLELLETLSNVYIQSDSSPVRSLVGHYICSTNVTLRPLEDFHREESWAWAAQTLQVAPVRTRAMNNSLQ